MANRVKVGDTLPEVGVQIWDGDKPKTVLTSELFADKKAVIFGVPGAFTPTCTKQHCPSYVNRAKELKAKGVDLVACTAVNDIFVLQAWGETLKATNHITFFGDGSGVLTKALGLEKDLVANGMGIRCYRFALIVDHGKIVHVAVDEGKYENTSAEAIESKL